MDSLKQINDVEHFQQVDIQFQSQYKGTIYPVKTIKDALDYHFSSKNEFYPEILREYDRMRDVSKEKKMQTVEVMKIRTLIALMLADGKIERDEKDFIKVLVNDLNMDDDTKRNLEIEVNEANPQKQPKVNLNLIDEDSKMELVISLVSLSMRDHNINNSEIIYIKNITTQLGIEQSGITEMLTTGMDANGTIFLAVQQLRTYVKGKIEKKRKEETLSTLLGLSAFGILVLVALIYFFFFV